MIVQKFGGTSVADVNRIRHVADIVASAAQQEPVVVVVSAMAGTTNQLVEWVEDISDNPSPAEYDTVVASGEQITSGLLALALQAKGVVAHSWQGWQLPLYTDTAHGNAQIEHMETDRLLRSLAKGEVAVVSGFQGMTRQARIATLGRGGSDTTAVALAATLGAERCDIYTDVDGVYSADPRIVPHAQRRDMISFEDMLGLATCGARVLHPRAVELAMREGVNVRVLSTFGSTGGTTLTANQNMLEDRYVAGIAHGENVGMITLHGVQDRAATTSLLLQKLRDWQIPLDLMMPGSEDGQGDITLTVARSDLVWTLNLLNTRLADCFQRLHVHENVARVSVIGIHRGAAQTQNVETVFRTLSDHNIKVLASATSDVKVSVLLANERVEEAVRRLHSAFGLDGQVDSKAVAEV